MAAWHIKPSLQRPQWLFSVTPVLWGGNSSTWNAKFVPPKWWLQDNAKFVDPSGGYRMLQAGFDNQHELVFPLQSWFCWSHGSTLKWEAKGIDPTVYPLVIWHHNPIYELCSESKPPQPGMFSGELLVPSSFWPGLWPSYVMPCVSRSWPFYMAVVILHMFLHHACCMTVWCEKNVPIVSMTCKLREDQSGFY